MKKIRYENLELRGEGEREAKKRCMTLRKKKKKKGDQTKLEKGGKNEAIR